MLVNDVKIKHACAGQKFKKIGHLDVNKVVWDSNEEIQPIIQSYEASCRIENIIARMALGDNTALVGSRGEGVYLDKETCELAMKDSITLKKQSDQIYMDSFNKFAGKNNISFNEFVKIVKEGKYEELTKYLPKKEKEDEVHE